MGPLKDFGRLPGTPLAGALTQEGMGAPHPTGVMEGLSEAREAIREMEEEEGDRRRKRRQRLWRQRRKVSMFHFWVLCVYSAN